MLLPILLYLLLLHCDVYSLSLLLGHIVVGILMTLTDLSIIQTHLAAQVNVTGKCD